MRDNGLKALQKRRYKKTTDSHHGGLVAANLFDQDFTCDAPDQKWGADISYIWTAEGCVNGRRDIKDAIHADSLDVLAAGDAKNLRFGMDRHLKSNTAKHRTHSLFKQRCMLYELIPNMPEVRLRPLIARFREYLSQHGAFNQTFAVV